MVTKNCAICDAEFEGHGNRKYCDAKECQTIKQDKVNSTKNKKHRKICPECNCSFMGYNTRKYCEDCTKIGCPNSEKECIVCGSLFKGHFNRHYCNAKECQATKEEKARLQSLEYASRPETKAKRLERERREDVKAKRKEYLTRPEVKERTKEYMKEYGSKWKKKNPEKVKAYQKKFAATEKGRLMRERASKKKLSTPKGRMMNRVRCNIYKHLKLRRLSKGGKTFDLLGYSGEELTTHLESQFTDGMSWDNIGAWHLDHIRPVSSFDFDSTDHPDFKKCWALNNLQPMWAKDNMSKGDKWDGKVNA